jgi:hypothetical protein
MDKLFYDGDASKIENEPLIQELIAEKKVEVRDNKLWFNALFNKGTFKFRTPFYNDMPVPFLWKTVPEGTWLSRIMNKYFAIDDRADVKPEDRSFFYVK